MFIVSHCIKTFNKDYMFALEVDIYCEYNFAFSKVMVFLCQMQICYGIELILGVM